MTTGLPNGRMTVFGREAVFAWALWRLSNYVSRDEIAIMLGRDRWWVDIWFSASEYWNQGYNIPAGLVLPDWQCVEPMTELLMFELRARDVFIPLHVREGRP